MLLALSVTQTHNPCGLRSRSDNLPPCVSTIAFAIDRPNPKPAASSMLRALSPADAIGLVLDAFGAQAKPRFVLERRHGQFVQRQFRSRPAAAIPARARRARSHLQTLTTRRERAARRPATARRSQRCSSTTRADRFATRTLLARRNHASSSEGWLFRFSAADGSVFPLHRKSEIAHGYGTACQTRCFLRISS